MRPLRNPAPIAVVSHDSQFQPNSTIPNYFTNQNNSNYPPNYEGNSINQNYSNYPTVTIPNPANYPPSYSAYSSVNPMSQNYSAYNDNTTNMYSSYGYDTKY